MYDVWGEGRRSQSVTDDAGAEQEADATDAAQAGAATVVLHNHRNLLQIITLPQPNSNFLTFAE